MHLERLRGRGCDGMTVVFIERSDVREETERLVRRQTWALAS
jgi:hypothetical protein